MDTFILLVEDNPEILDGNRYFLERSGYQVRTAQTLAEARACVAAQVPRLIVLDIMLPDGSGLGFLRDLRQTSQIPVLLLTSLSEASDVVRGLMEGGDDYLAKPYDFSVFLARVKALLRRSGCIPEVIQKGALALDLFSSRAFLNGKDLFLTPKQFALLLLLFRNEGETLSPDYLYKTIWKQPLTDNSNALWKQISHLKTKLTDQCGINLSLFRGQGYCLEISDLF